MPSLALQLVMIIILSSCGGEESSNGSGSNDSVWEFNNYETPSITASDLAFPSRYLLDVSDLESGYISGKYECNTFSGAASLVDGVLSISAISVTAERCAYEVESVSQEDAVFTQAIFGGPLLFTLTGETLQLVDVDQSILNFTPKDSK